MTQVSSPSFSSTTPFYTPAIISFLSNKYDYAPSLFLHFSLISHLLFYKGQVLWSGYSASSCNPNIHFQFHFLPLSTTILNSKPQWTSHISFQNSMPLHISFSLPEMPFLPLLYSRLSRVYLFGPLADTTALISVYLIYFFMCLPLPLDWIL